MATTSASRSAGLVQRIQAATSTLLSDSSFLIADIRKALNLIKEAAVESEKDGETQLVKELEKCFLELLESSEDYTHFCSAIQSFGNTYQPGEGFTDFNKFFDDEIEKLKAESPFIPKDQSLFRQFKQALWNVSKTGIPMPGEEQEDIIMTSTQCILLNITCPLTGKPVTELANPVRSGECKHIYEKNAIYQYIDTATTASHQQQQQQQQNARCPVAGCPRMVDKGKVVCDPLLRVEIEEARSMKSNTRARTRANFTDLVEDE